MDPEEDYMTILAAEEKIATSEAARKKELEEVHANLKGPRTRTITAASPNPFFAPLDSADAGF
jgi:kinetochore protein Spc24